MTMLRRTMAVLFAGALAFLVYLILLAGQPPVLRTVHVHVPNWPAGAPPVRIALLSDTHTAWPGDTPARLAATVARIAAQRPDLVLFAGDAISNDSVAFAADPHTAVAALGALHPPLGKFAVLGNHDYRQARAVTRALTDAGFRVLDNEAARAGPLAILGVADADFQLDDAPKAVAAGARIGGVPVMVTHNPVPIYKLSDTVPLALAGHTHCDQVVLPWFGAIATEARDKRYTCGIVREAHRVTVITGGLGTSKLPIRLNAPPDFWIVTVGG